MLKKYFLLLLLVLCIPISFILLSFLPLVEATPNQFITIEISKTCLYSLFQNNTRCPSYADILYLDSSLPIISGQFQENDQGFLERQPPQLRNFWKYFDLENQTRIVVDPSYEMYTRGQNIHLVLNTDSFVFYSASSPANTPSFSNTTASSFTSATTPTKNTQNTAFLIDNDMISPPQNCKTMYINAENWKIYLENAINYFKSNCDPKLSLYDPTPRHIPKKSNIDIITSPNYQYSQQIKRIIDNCIFKYGSCSELPQ